MRWRWRSPLWGPHDPVAETPPTLCGRGRRAQSGTAGAREWHRGGRVVARGFAHGQPQQVRGRERAVAAAAATRLGTQPRADHAAAHGTRRRPLTGDGRRGVGGTVVAARGACARRRTIAAGQAPARGGTRRRRHAATRVRRATRASRRRRPPRVPRSEWRWRRRRRQRQRRRRRQPGRWRSVVPPPWLAVRRRTRRGGSPAACGSHMHRHGSAGWRWEGLEGVGARVDAAAVASAEKAKQWMTWFAADWWQMWPGTATVVFLFQRAKN